MDTMRILVANEPQAYRQVMAAAVQQLRPNYQVMMIAPDQLDCEVMRHDPHVVVCSQLSEVVQAHPLTWILLYPDGETRAMFSVNGHITSVGDLEFTNLMAIFDQTEHLAQES